MVLIREWSNPEHEGALMRFKFAFELLENARSFLESAADYIQDGGDQHRFALLHLATAIELLLKARLALEDHKLLVVGTKPVTDEAFARGDFRSVNLDEAIERLEGLGQLAITPSQRAQLVALRNMRNRVTHFVPPVDAVEAKAALAIGVSLFVDIHNAEFADEDVYKAKPMQRILEELSKSKDFIHARHAHIAERLRRSARPRTHHLDERPRCLQDAAAIVAENIECFFCGLSRTVHDCTWLLSEDGTVGACPACGRTSVARHAVGKGTEPTFECFCCGQFTGPELNWFGYGGTPTPRLKEFG